MKKLKWGILGTGRIAKVFAQALQSSNSGKLAAVGSRSSESADAFGKEFGIERCHSTYESLLQDSEVEAVYISTPHSSHAEWAIKAAEAGKHILCEKPLTLSLCEAQSVIESAKMNDVFLMEAFMYRCHPQTLKLVDLLKKGVIGKVHLIQASFGFLAKMQPEGRLFKNELGGGGILDVGCYPTSMAILIASAALGKESVEPIDVKAFARIGETGVDEWSSAVISFPDDIIAQVSTSIRCAQENVVRIFGSEGHIVIPHPWIITSQEGHAIHLFKKGVKSPQIIPTRSKKNVYRLESDVVSKYLAQRQPPFPLMTWDHTLANMKALDDWRNSIELIYDAEKVENQRTTITKRPLRAKSDTKMRYLNFEGSSKKISQLVMGSMIQNPQLAAFLYDSYFEGGGNAFDTAFIYKKATEEGVGQWIKSRGVREKVFLIGKGAHTPHCDPKNLTEQLFKSLEHLKTEYVDLYLMHRDNLEIPVGEFVDVLNEHYRAGRMRSLGVSNWTLKRIDEANAYAKKKGLQGLTSLSHQFSLAQMMNPVWPDALSVSDPESIQWLKERKFPLFAWSSQARGFFTERGDPLNGKEKEMIQCWFGKENFEKRERALKLAKQKGVLPINIALAYVLQQDFPLFALIGPRTVEEVRTTFQVLDLTLTPAEMDWLGLKTEAKKTKVQERELQLA
jgi:predicted dehydrogenase/aryl-alcohol dehydrogenase-like predicted oxidoreductase